MSEAPELELGINTTIYTFYADNTTSYQNGGYMGIERILSGRKYVRIGKKEQTVSEGDIIITQPYDEVFMRCETDGVYQGFVFDAPQYFDDIGLPPLFRFESFIGKDEEIRHYCEGIQEEYVHQTSFHETALRALTSLIVIRLYRMYGEKATGALDTVVSKTELQRNFGKQKVVREALAYIYENCQNGISSRDIAAHVNVSLSYLCRCFSQVFGETVLDYSDRIRCRKAHEELSLGTFSVGEIAAKYHFSSLSYFNRRYKKFYGTNPASTLADAKTRHRG